MKFSSLQPLHNNPWDVKVINESMSENNTIKNISQYPGEQNHSLLNKKTPWLIGLIFDTSADMGISIAGNL